MKEQITNPLEQAFANMLNRIIEGMDNGVDFLNAQLPEVVEQLLTWKMYESILDCIMGFVLIIFSLKAPFMAYRKYKKSSLEWDAIAVDLVFIFGGFAAFILCVAGFCKINFTWLQILIAPKIYLIEYATELIK